MSERMSGQLEELERINSEMTEDLRLTVSDFTDRSVQVRRSELLSVRYSNVGRRRGLP